MFMTSSVSPKAPTLAVRDQSRRWKSFIKVEANARRIEAAYDELRKKDVQTILHIGKELHDAQLKLARYGEGTFIKWCKNRLSYSKSSVYRMIRAFEKFGLCANLVQTIDVSALYELADNNTPKKAREECLALGKDRHHLTRRRVLEIIANYRTPSPLSAEEEDLLEKEAGPPPIEERSNSRLDRMKCLWERATPEQRNEFMSWIRTRRVKTDLKVKGNTALNYVIGKHAENGRY